MAKNQLKIGVVLSYLSLGLNMVVQLLYTPVMIRILGQSEYGLYTLVGSVVSYLSLFSLGFTGAYLRFYSIRKAQNDTEKIAELNGMFLLLFLLMSTLAIICGFILSCFPREIFGNNLTESELQTARVLMVILVVNVALTFPSSLFDSIISAHEQFVFQRVVTLAGVIGNPLIALPLLIIGYGSVAVVSVTTLITVAKLIVNIFYCFKVIKVRFSFRNFDFDVLKEIAGFSFFIFLNMIIDQINWSVDKFILGRVSGTTAVAVYGVGSSINSIFTTFSTSISSVFSPRVNRIVANNVSDVKDQLTDIFIKVGRIQYLVLMLIASGFVFFGKFFITDIFSTKEYVEAYPVALLLMLPAFVPLIQNVGIEIQRAMNKHHIRAVIYLGMAIFNVIISIPLAKLYGPVGSALGTAIGLILCNGVIINIYYCKGMHIDIVSFWKSIVRLSRGMIIPILLGMIVMKYITFNSMLLYLGCVLMYTIAYCISMWLFGMNVEEKRLMLSPINKVFSRIKGGNRDRT